MSIGVRGQEAGAGEFWQSARGEKKRFFWSARARDGARSDKMSARVGTILHGDWARRGRKRQRTGAVQDAAARFENARRWRSFWQRSSAGRLRGEVAHKTDAENLSLVTR